MRTLFFLFLLSITIFSCQKSNSPGNPKIPPNVSTVEINSITYNSVVIAGNVTADGGESITARGVCWKNSPTPDISGSHTTDGIGTGTFNSNITGLNSGTTYYVRAYATNSKGTAYGSELSFTTSTPDVYVSGYEGNVAKLWKNGIPINLTDASTSAAGYSVFVSGSDVFVGGFQSVASGDIFSKIWKNGTMTTLSNRSGGVAYSVFVSGADVYATGSDGALWKNGTFVFLGNIDTTAFGYSVYVSGADVFVGGDSYSPTRSVAYATTWKNGIMTRLSTIPSAVRSVFAAGSDLYAAGIEKPASTTIATIWKNGTATSLTDGTKIAYANSVFVSGTNVYVAGSEAGANQYYVAKIWKNGVGTSLTDGTTHAEANSVYIVGSDVYAAGYEYTGSKTVAKLWKNGVATSLTNGTNSAKATSVFVK